MNVRQCAQCKIKPLTCASACYSHVCKARERMLFDWHVLFHKVNGGAKTSNWRQASNPPHPLSDPQLCQEGKMVSL